MSVEVTAESTVNPTEDEEKVERALRNIFPSGSIQKTKKQNDTVLLTVRGTGLECLANLRNLIRQDRIRSAARSIFFARERGQRMEVYLNKQAAFAGRVSFCAATGESPNGPISIEIQSPNLQSVLDFLASNLPQDFTRVATGRRRQ